MINIVITADYEIFGNGSGDVRDCLISPTNEILRICNDYGVKLTLFFEVVEYWAYKRNEEEGNLNHLEYRPSVLMEQQAIDAIRDGHDVQLHLHPQWLGSHYIQDRWQLNLDYWCLPNVPNGIGEIGDIFSLRGLLYQGKSTLESLLSQHVSGYECMALRAGGWCIQPSADVMRVMKEVGFIADSSVYKGGFINDDLYNIDFRDAHSELNPWMADPDDINKVIGCDLVEGIWELPIFTRTQRRITRINLHRIGLFLNRKSNLKLRPDNCRGAPAKSSKSNRKLLLSPRRLFNFLIEPVAKQWDFCNLNAGEMWNFFNYFLREHYNLDKNHTLVMIGHPKEFNNYKEFHSFLNKISRHELFSSGNLRFVSISEAIKSLREAKEY